MIIRHYEVFKSELGSQELNQENWDVLRTESKESAYAIEDNVEQYEKNCLSCVSYEVAAGRILDVLKEHHCGHVVSMGIGKGILEWHLKRQMPELIVEGTDFAVRAVEKLKKVFPACDALHCFDMLRGDYRMFPPDAFFIFYRVSEEFCYEDWRHIFTAMRSQRVLNIVYIPDMLATRQLAERLERSRAHNQKQGRKETFCGWIYSEDTLEELFCAGGYQIIRRSEAGTPELMMYVLKAVDDRKGSES